MAEQAPNCVRVKRDGPRGWHWIAAEHYDPKVHEMVPDSAVKEAAPVDDFDHSDPLNIPSASEEAVAESAGVAPANKPTRKAKGK